SLTYCKRLLCLVIGSVQGSLGVSFIVFYWNCCDAACDVVETPYQYSINCYDAQILRLQECLSKYERSDDGSTPQVDLAHLLAARDQELRTLSAEMNQLQSELRLARSLIAEKDSEIQRVRNTNNQYVEENERLRAILGEWSTTAAKLERALEAERISNLELQKKITLLKSQTTQEQVDPTLQLDQ
ncbi:UNVERIFIED_CONTAM: protein FIP1, partial [Sesamum radiatum]